MIPVVLLATAAAAPPTDAGSLAEAEPEALALIAHCREVTHCAPEPLAEAYLTRAVAAAVLRGELDVSGAASARLLDPRAASAWEHVLPASDPSQVEPWLRPALVTAAATSTETAPIEDPPRYRVSRVSLQGTGSSEALQAGTTFSLRAPVYGRFGANIAVTTQLTAADLLGPADETGLSLDLGFGRRTLTASGRETYLWSALRLSSQAATAAAFTPRTDPATAPPPLQHAVGSHTGVLWIRPLASWTSLRAEGSLGMEWRGRPADYVAPGRGDFPEDRVAVVPNVVEARAGLEWRVHAGDGWTVGPGVQAVWTSPLVPGTEVMLPRLWPSVAVSTRL